MAFTFGCSWTLIGLVIIGLAIPLARGRVRPNNYYGVRFPQSYQSDEAWYAINCFGGKRLIAWAVPLVILGVGCFFLKVNQHTGLTLVLGLIPLMFLFPPILQSWRFAREFR